MAVMPIEFLMELETKDDVARATLIISTDDLAAEVFCVVSPNGNEADAQVMLVRKLIGMIHHYISQDNATMPDDPFTGITVPDFPPDE